MTGTLASRIPDSRAENAAAEPLVDLRDFRLGFQTMDGFREVLHGIDITVRPGEMVGLVGESGSGKSVTAKYVLGVLPDRARVTGGSARLLGEDALSVAPRVRQLLKRNVAYIPQDPMMALNPSFVIGSQMEDFILWGRSGQSLRRYTALKWSRKARREARDHAARLLDMVHIRDTHLVLKSYPYQLSGGMRQRVLIAIAMSGTPRLLVADEPTTALDVTVQKRTVDLIHELVEREKLAGLYITHDLGVARWLCPRSYVMHEGKVVEEGPTRRLLDAPEHPYTRKLVAAIPRLHDPVAARPLTAAPGAESGPPYAIRVRELARSFGEKQAVRGVSFDVAPGETFALVGESGSGKSTIAQMIAGQLEPTSGEIRINAADLHDAGLNDRARFREAVQMVWQDPSASLNPRQSVEQIIGLPLRLRGVKDGRQRRDQIVELLDKVALPAWVMDRTPRSLSGGQKQRVSIARALAMQPEILILDEPTSALDVSVQARILELLKDLRAREKLTYLLITHDLGVVRALADRTAVMLQGRIVEIGSTSDILFSPADDYTRALIDAVPSVDSSDENRRAWASGGPIRGGPD